ncbi:PepSY domain-containing protein [Virgibacillus halophilus]|uniref:PepSY domain-containing protein n=1 Tax=Tigheibacillus halophilus TaxID=361280 RepID=A0ABU5CA07_9BACI|nr:PepSY domain-containing protein [Virgibacillus halophilus]
MFYDGYYYPPVNGYSGMRRVTIEEAMHTALQQVPGQVIKIELDTEHGIQVYEVDIVTAQGVKYEVNVAVDTGEIVNIELD